MSKQPTLRLLRAETVVSFISRVASSGDNDLRDRESSPATTGHSYGQPSCTIKFRENVSPAASTRPIGRILVVEDDPAVQKALRRLFETEGYAVETQSDGRSALESFQTSAPAAVVLDLRLPKVSGRDVCKEIKALAPTVPIVVLSAASDVSDKVLLLELGADDYVNQTL